MFVFVYIIFVYVRIYLLFVYLYVWVHICVYKSVYFFAPTVWWNKMNIKQ